jgi:CRP/FNR family cyclic AMP-dependent transcriptional regulator
LQADSAPCASRRAETPVRQRRSAPFSRSKYEKTHLALPQSSELEIFLTTEGEGRRFQAYRPGEIILNQGDQADAVFYIRAGKIKRTVTSSQGKEAVVSILDAGDFFGEACLAGESNHQSRATAISDLSVLRIERVCAAHAFRVFPSFSQMLVSYLVRRNARIEEDLIDQLFNSSEKRLARLLLRMADFDKERKPETTIGRITQETLANMVGTTRSRINYFMNRFRARGFIDYNGEIKVYSSLLIVVIHD